MKNQEINSGNCCNRLVRGTAFIPFRKRCITVCDNVGFSLIELVVVIMILSVLIAFALPAFSHFLDTAKSTRCIADIRTLDKDITAYLIDKGVLPDDLSQINRANFKDPWGNPYVYTNLTIVGSVPYKDFADQDLNDDFDLYSKGKNGNTTGDLDDTISLDDIIRSGDGGNVGLGSHF